MSQQQMKSFFTYSCYTDPPFSELVKVNEEFLDSNSIFGDQGLESLLNIQLALHVRWLALLRRRVETIHNRNS